MYCKNWLSNSIFVSVNVFFLHPLELSYYSNCLHVTLYYVKFFLMYLEKIIPISVKCRRNGDFILHIANFESGLDRAPVFGPIKLFNSLNVLKKTISRRKSGETAVLQDIKRRLNYKIYNYDAAESEENINIYISIVLNYCYMEKTIEKKFTKI